MTMVALGVCIVLIQAHNYTFAGLWAVITVGWFGCAMWLWRQHHNASN
jgi:hypothetical protein